MSYIFLIEEKKPKGSSKSSNSSKSSKLSNYKLGISTDYKSLTVMVRQKRTHYLSADVHCIYPQIKVKFDQSFSKVGHDTYTGYVGDMISVIKMTDRS